MVMNSYTGKPELTSLDPIANDGFFPDLAMADFVTTYRIPTEYDNDVIKGGLILAMIEVNKQLSPIHDLLISYATLLAFCQANSEQIGGVEILILKYQEAVFCYAKAQLLQQFKTMNRKAEAENLAKEAPETEQYWLNRSCQAIQFFFDKFHLVNKPLVSGSVGVYLL